MHDRLAVDQHAIDWQPGDGVADRGKSRRQIISEARPEAHTIVVLHGDDAKAIELYFMHPLWPARGVRSARWLRRRDKSRWTPLAVAGGEVSPFHAGDVGERSAKSKRRR